MLNFAHPAQPFFMAYRPAMTLKSRLAKRKSQDEETKEKTPKRVSVQTAKTPEYRIEQDLFGQVAVLLFAYHSLLRVTLTGEMIIKIALTNCNRRREKKCSAVVRPHCSVDRLPACAEPMDLYG